jgi:hypothetical protein
MGRPDASILRRSSALGLVAHGDSEERFLKTPTEARDLITVALAGRAAEEQEYGEASSGISSDLAAATTIASQLVGQLGHGPGLLSLEAASMPTAANLVAKVLSDEPSRQAAEDLMKDLNMSANDLDQAAQDINRMAKQEMTQEEKEQLRQKLQELREMLRQQSQGGSGQMARLRTFQQRALVTRQRRAEDFDGSGGGHELAGQCRQQRRLAAARRSQHRGHAAARHDQVDALEHGAAAAVEAEAGQADDGRRLGHRQEINGKPGREREKRGSLAGSG